MFFTIRKICFLMLLVVFCSGNITNAASYTSVVRSAIGKAAEGQTRESFAIAAQAADYEPGDPLTLTLLGYLQAMGGSADSARSYYNAAIKKNPECAQALYGLGLLALNSEKPEVALELLIKAQAAGPLLNMRSTLEYAKYLCTGTAKEFTESADQLLYVIEAHGYAGQGKCDTALKMLEQSLQKTGRFPYKEVPGLSASFDPAKAVAASAWPMRKTDVLKSFKERKIVPVTGILTLTAGLKRADSVRMVTFMVDDRAVCITNQPPFSYDWNSAKVADGPHTVVTQGTSASGSVVTSETRLIFVKNNTGSAAEKDRINYFKAWTELFEAMRLKPSVCGINYQIALCALEARDNDAAIAALENVLAINPEFRDAKSRLIKLRGGGRTDVKVYSSRSSASQVAITFDDGPTPAVTGALEILKQKQVRATFFVVGKQVETFPELLASIHKGGHEVQNHTFNHFALSYLNESMIEREYFQTSAAVRHVIGVGTSCIRPPGGRTGEAMFKMLRQYGVSSIFWSINCVKSEGTNINKLTSYVLSNVRPGSIILMHYGDGVGRKALPGIIDGLKKKRFKFVTVSELLSE